MSDFHGMRLNCGFYTFGEFGLRTVHESVKKTTATGSRLARGWDNICTLWSVAWLGVGVVGDLSHLQIDTIYDALKSALVQAKTTE